MNTVSCKSIEVSRKNWIMKAARWSFLHVHHAADESTTDRLNREGALVIAKRLDEENSMASPTSQKITQC
jgi:hypothetical protein